MLSILIPNYQYDCSDLVVGLDKQAKALQEEVGNEFDYEILVSDDASDSIYIYSMQEKLAGLAKCRLMVQPRNLGRATNRNALIRAAHFPWILLIDSDARIDKADFLACYWTNRTPSGVVYGGIETSPQPLCDGENYTLRTKYELSARKHRTLNWRRRHPYQNFSTFNFMAHRSVFENNLFDTRIHSYGHEDTLFGFALQEKRIPIKHIDNPLTHIGIDSNEEFLQKTRQALQTLCSVDDARLSSVGAIRIWRKLHAFHLDRILPGLGKVAPLLEKNLLSRRPRLWMLKLYKLLYFCQLKRASQSP